MNSKQEVLKLLSENCGSYLSGEAIAVRLGLSRNSVWKAINALRKSGYHIEAVTNRGYCLTEAGDVLSGQDLQKRLDPDIHLSELRIEAVVDSTNRLAKEMAIQGACHGSVVIADHQTHGNAHHANAFFSPAGGLYMSVILLPKELEDMTPSLLTKYTAGSICRALEETAGVHPSIHNVNDLYLKDRKVGGILTESVTDFESGDYQWIVVGIGINMKVSEAELPSELQGKATSLRSEQAQVPSRNEIAAAILNRLLKRPYPNAAEIGKLYASYHI